MGLMSREVASSLLKNIFVSLSPRDIITFAFQGGEPSLAGLGFFYFFASEAEKLSPRNVEINYTFQTNGMLIDDDWCDFFIEKNVLVGLSLDGYLHDENRFDKTGEKTLSRVLEKKNMLDKRGVTYNILWVLTGKSSIQTNRVWDFIVRENLKYVQFVPCLEMISPSANRVDTLTPQKFYRFYAALFQQWKREVKNGNIINIRLFDDLANLYMTKQHIACGISGRCTPQIVVEANGNVYPCDFYAMDEYLVGNICTNSIEEIYNMIVSSTFISKNQRLHKWCDDCKYNMWCHGGCRRMFLAVYDEPCGMRMFLDKCINDLIRIATGIYRT